MNQWHSDDVQLYDGYIRSFGRLTSVPETTDTGGGSTLHRGWRDHRYRISTRMT